MQIFPNIRQITEEFKLKWEKNLSLCSSNMMTMLIEYYQSEIVEFDLEIEKMLKK